MMRELKERYLRVRKERLRSVFRVGATILRAIRDYLYGQKFIEILPPILAPATDPGIRGAARATVNYYGRKYFLTTSMILYKQMMICAFERVFALSPNIRLEIPEAKHTGRHLAEFWQVDLEVARASCEDVMQLGEELYCKVCGEVKKNCARELELLGRNLKLPGMRFRKIHYIDAINLLREKGVEVGEEEEIPWYAEEKLSSMFTEPFWVVNYPYGSRGFYDKQDPENPKWLLDFDLIYPEGYGEAISGGEREYEYDKVLRKIKDFGNNEEEYRLWYLPMLKEGIIPSAGFGIGVERLTKYICGLKHLWDATPFPRVPGVYSP